MQVQQGDVLLFQTIDDGNIEVVDGITTMTGSFETAFYLSLFGGNEKDDGRDGNTLQYWANFMTNETAFQYRSETQFLLNTLPLTTANLVKIQEAALRDLQWFLDLSIASSVVVVATIPGLNKINICITVTAFGEESSFNFTENWQASQ